ncbi:MAG TPA: cytochrome c oxidase assembly protein [Gammaproteobacteria bacterium]|nr:cytochrome c oxidase assembly protein [Gammaproteobacteria bacterium]
MHVSIASILQFVAPYEFSPTVALVALLSLAAYIRGLRLRGLKGRGARAFAFITGVVLMYASLQTQYDYWSQHMFFVHRAQHLILHHLGPFLIALSAPFATLHAGVPEPIRGRALDPILANRVLRACYRAVQQPVVSGILFVGLIYFWLIPQIHFYAMLNVPTYNAMNWGMAIDGLLFWHVMLDRRVPSPGGAAGYGIRLGILIAVAFPQILLGALISFAQHDLYPVYAVCGRMWPISPVVDQQLGGLITWIPPAMMSFVGLLVVLSQWMRNANPEGLPAAAVQR